MRAIDLMLSLDEFLSLPIWWKNPFYAYKHVSVFWRLNKGGDSLQKDLYDENEKIHLWYQILLQKNLK